VHGVKAECEYDDEWETDSDDVDDCD